MDKVGLLCKKDDDLLRTFSNRCLERITGRTLPTLPFVSTYLDANVMKEIEKDRLIITRAAAACAVGEKSGSLNIEEIFEETRNVDRAFVKKIALPSLAIQVRYEDIAAVRKERIVFLAGAVEDILIKWGNSPNFDEAVRKTYSATNFRGAIVTLLHLYNEETRMLSNSVRFLPPFNKAMNLFADTLFEAMEEVKEELADACSQSVFGVPSRP